MLMSEKGNLLNYSFTICYIDIQYLGSNFNHDQIPLNWIIQILRGEVRNQRFPWKLVFCLQYLFENKKYVIDAGYGYIISDKIYCFWV